MLSVCASLAWSDVASAHEFEARHRAIVTAQASDGGVGADVLLLMELPPSTRASRLISLYDMDRSGDLNALESQMAASSLGAEAVGGYVLHFGGRPAQPRGVKAIASLDGRGGLVVALLLEYRWVAPKEGASRLEVRVVSGAKEAPLRGAPVSVEIQVAPPLRIGETSGPRASDAPVVGPVTVKPGKPGCWVSLVREG